MPPLELDNLEARLVERYGRSLVTGKDVLSAALYPKVYEEYQVRAAGVCGGRVCVGVGVCVGGGCRAATRRHLHHPACAPPASTHLADTHPAHAPCPPPPPTHTYTHACTANRRLCCATAS
jgi:hypothetical protein